MRVSSRTVVAASLAVAGHRPLSLAIAMASCFASIPALAQPTGALAVHGSASLSQQGNRLVVTTANGAGTGHSAINWQSFSIPAGQATHFAQPNAASTSINRVLGNNPSAIFGTLSSNGKLVLVNPSGIAVGAGAVVDTAGFTASTLRMRDADAIAGRMLFGDGTVGGALSVGGQILARSGDAVLIAPQVDVAAGALVQSPGGATVLAAGRTVEITGRGLEGIRLQVQAPQDSAVNLGTLTGDAVAMFAGTLKHSGLAQATAVTAGGGRVVLRAAGDALVDGNASATAGNRGGGIDVLGERVALHGQAVLDVSGTAGGGTVRIGGDYQGANADVPNAKRTFVGEQTTIRADATGSGDGGRVIVWADEVTRALGSIQARGGAQGGDGGFVETSGKRDLAFRAKVDVSAPHGAQGTVLLDPTTINIVGGTGDGTTDGTNTTAGTPSNLAGAINFSDTGPTTVYQSELEGIVGGNVVLEATSGITTGGTFTGGAVVMANNTNLTLRTRNAGGDGTGGINLVGSVTGVNLEWRTQGTGTITMEAGTDPTPQAVALTVGKLSTQGGAVTVKSSGSAVVRGVATTPGAPGNGGAIEIKSGGFMTLDDIDARGNGAGTAGNVTLDSGNAIYVSTNKTVYANQLKMKAANGITDGTVTGPAAVQASALNVLNTGGHVLIKSLADLTLSDLGLAAGYSVKNLGIGGNITLSSTGKITASSQVSSSQTDITLVADKMDIAANLTTGSATAGSVTLRPFGAGTAIDLGSTANTNAPLELSDAELDRVTAGLLRIGGATYTGGISLTQHISLGNSLVDQLSLVSGGNIQTTSFYTLAANKLNAESAATVMLGNNNSVTQLSGTYDGTGGFTFNGNGAVQIATVDGRAGVTAKTTAASGNVAITSSGLLTVNENITSGDSGGNVTLTGGGITLGASKTVSAPVGNVTLNGGTSGNLSLGAGTLSTVGGSITLRDAANVTLGAVNGGGGGSLLVNTNITGTINQDATNFLNISNLNAVATGTINLNNTANQLTTVQGLSTTNSPITLYDSTGGLTISGTNVNAGTALVDIRTTDGNLTLNSTSAITSGGATLMAQGTSRNLLVQGNITGGSTLNAANSVLFSGTAKTIAGAANITAGTGVVQLSGSYTFNNPITSANIFEVASGGTLTAGGIITIPKLKISSGGTVTGSNQISVPTSFDWTGGTVTGSGNLNLAGTSSITGGVTLSRPVNNSGTITQSGAGAVTMASGGSINNTGIYDIQNDNGFAGTSGTFTNSGTFKKTGGAGTSLIGGLTFSNFSNKTVQVTSGTLAFGSGVFTGNSGVIDIGAGGVFSTVGNFANNTTGVIQGVGTLNVGAAVFDNFGTLRPGGAGTIGTLTLSAGSYNHHGPSKFDIDLTSHTVHDIVMHTGAGTVTMGAGSFAGNDVAATYAVGDTFAFAQSASGTIGGSVPTATGLSFQLVAGAPYLMQATKLAAAPSPSTPSPPPVTQPPVTQPPVTQPPVTQPPVTQPPVTQPPVAQPPATPPPPAPVVAEPTVDQIVALLRSDVPRAQVREAVAAQDNVVTSFVALLLNEEQRQAELRDKERPAEQITSEVQCTR